MWIAGIVLQTAGFLRPGGWAASRSAWLLRSACGQEQTLAAVSFREGHLHASCVVQDARRRQTLGMKVE
jgi:hypothetical protein